jgi:16S rRNA (cytidine1402-2'-O)-methyltransferase
MPGTLYVVATPLGNLEDLSPRAERLLASVAAVACEDTRRASRLLARRGIDVPLISCHKFNERERLEPLLERLRRGDDVALVSDGGTPAVSDPGALLVQAAHDEGIAVCPVPGPSAVATLLSVSGFDASRYVFDGFLPHRGGERRRRLRELRGETRTVVVFETPHRVHAALRDIGEVLGSRPLVLGRELTKQHETILRGDAAAVARDLGEAPVRGEITIVLAGASGSDDAEEPLATRVREAWTTALADAGGGRREALRRAARALGLKRAELQRVLDELGL